MKLSNTYQAVEGSILLTDGLISEVTGVEQPENDQYIQLWLSKSVLFAIFSHPGTGETSSFLRVPLKGSLIETHITNTENKCSVVRIAGVDSPFVIPKEKLGLFIEASTTIET